MGNIAKPFIRGTATIGTWFGVNKSSVGNLGKNIFGVTNPWGAVEGKKREMAMAAEAEKNAAPTIDSEAAGFAQRDRIRRLAARAQGQASTIRSTGATALYSATPKSLIGQ